MSSIPVIPPKTMRYTQRDEASDPSTPIARLVELAARFPDEVLRNPALELAMVCDTAFIEGLPTASLLALLRSQHVPEHLLTQCAAKVDHLQRTCPKAGHLLAQHPAAPAAAIARLEGTTYDAAARLHVRSRHAHSTPWEDQVGAVGLLGHTSIGRSQDARIVGAMARTGMIDADEPFCRALLLAMPTGISARFLAHQPVLPADLQSRFIEQAVRGVVDRIRGSIGTRSRLRKIFARAPKPVRGDPAAISAEEALVLAESKSGDVRAKAVRIGADQLPPAVLRRLAVDRCIAVRRSMAEHRGIAVEDAVVLARDRVASIRRLLAERCPVPEALLVLARDPEPSIRAAVATNLACTADVDSALLDESSARECVEAGWAAGRRINQDGAPLARKDGSDRWTAAECAMLALRSPVHSASRLLLLASAACPEEVLLDHADSESTIARLAVARNPRTPRATLGGLAMADATWVVRDAATDALNARAALGWPSPGPALPASEISERFMADEVVRDLRTMRRMLRDPCPDTVCEGIRRGYAIPELRRSLRAGMLVTSRSIRASAMSELRLNVAEEHLQAAEACLAVRMGEGG